MSSSALFRYRRAALAMLPALALWTSAAAAQEQPSSVRIVTEPAKVQPAGRPGPAAAKGAPDEKPNEGTKKQPAEAKAGGKDEEKPSEPEVLKRPDKPPHPPDPAQFKIMPDEAGKVRFAFVGAPWPDLLRWLARVSGKSLDWQELPADYLNLVTQRSYTIPEAQDVINRHLLARGFTLLQNGESLTVANVKKLDPGLVPRVEPDELAGRSPHEFVKVSFDLDWLPAETAAKELKPMLSPNGKLSALTATNRLEAMDAANNLQQIYEVLTREQSSGGRSRLVRVFKLKHTRAAQVLEQLKGLLGMESDKPASAMTPQQVAMLQQQIRSMSRQQQGQQAPSANKPKDDIHLVVNARENTILANAPPDKMAVIAQAIEAIDVEPDRTPLLRNLEGVRVYRLSGIDPETLVKFIEKTGDLSPGAQLEIDEKNKAVIAFATAVDHLTIRMLVDKLDGSNRRFEVIPLRKLEADYVAGTIARMLGGEDEEEDRGRRRSPFYYFGSYSRRDSDSGSTDKFRVDADVEFNRLLVWANEVELEEVENLLVKLGEIAPPGGNPNTLRVLDRLPDEERERLLERLRRIWPSIAPNELLLPSEEPPEQRSPDAEAPPVESPPASHNAAVDRGGVAGAEQDASPQRARLGAHFVRPQPPTVTVSHTRQTRESPALSQDSDRQPPQGAGPDTETARQEDGSRQGAGRSSNPPPVSITRSPDGRLIIASQDTRALDRLEEVLRRLAPPARDYKVFKLKYDTTWAWGVAMNLEDFFKDESERSSTYDPFFGYYSGNGGDSETSRRLSKRRPLKFIADDDSHTIIVQGASPGQLRTIEELIEIYDRPPDTDSKSIRRTEMFHIKYSQADVIAAAIKDVYRDLLSANDPALAQQNQKRPNEQKTQTSTVQRTYIYGSPPGEDEQEPERPITFKGLLSVGVDELSNVLIVSATEGLLENIRPMVEALDEAAKPPPIVVRVVPSNGGVDPALLNALVQHATTGKPEEQPQQPRRETPEREDRPKQAPAAQPNGTVDSVIIGGQR